MGLFLPTVANAAKVTQRYCKAASFWYIFLVKYVCISTTSDNYCMMLMKLYRTYVSGKTGVECNDVTALYVALWKIPVISSLFNGEVHRDNFELCCITIISCLDIY